MIPRAKLGSIAAAAEAYHTAPVNPSVLLLSTLMHLSPRD